MGSIIGAGESREKDDTEVVELLDPGDTVEVGVSSLYRQGGIECWLKVGTNVHVRPDETPEDAFDRGYTFCLGGLAEAIAQLQAD